MKSKIANVKKVSTTEPRYAGIVFLHKMIGSFLNKEIKV
jgi:hypothetical protein